MLIEKYSLVLKLYSDAIYDHLLTVIGVMCRGDLPKKNCCGFPLQQNELSKSNIIDYEILVISIFRV